MLDWILPLFPEHREYLEPFIGSGAVFLNKKPAKVECINDLDGRLINFFRIVRERTQELIDLLTLTPYAREEFQLAGEVSDDPLEDARRYFVRSTMSFGGITHTIRRMNSYRVDVQESRMNIAACISKYNTKIKNLPAVLERLREAQIDNRSAFYLIPKFNFPTTFQYQDPPYDHSSRTNTNDYKYEMTTEDHVKLALLNHQSKAMIMISHYDDELYNHLYRDWHKHLGPIRKTNLSKSTVNREAVWMNYKKAP